MRLAPRILALAMVVAAGRHENGTARTRSTPIAWPPRRVDLVADGLSVS
ncbi:MAG TPA: hypothetical protein VN947_12395 [Polyangia bacterium]|nr:hypothetical protein [Polyangia bacterium]